MTRYIRRAAVILTVAMPCVPALSADSSSDSLRDVQSAVFGAAANKYGAVSKVAVIREKCGQPESKALNEILYTAVEYSRQVALDEINKREELSAVPDYAKEAYASDLGKSTYAITLGAYSAGVDDGLSILWRGDAIELACTSIDEITLQSIEDFYK